MDFAKTFDKVPLSHLYIQEKEQDPELFPEGHQKWPEQYLMTLHPEPLFVYGLIKRQRSESDLADDFPPRQMLSPYNNKQEKSCKT
jgi:hypothetical protein